MIVNDNRIPKQIINWQPQERRRLWERELEKDLWNDREQWRLKVRKHRRTLQIDIILKIATIFLQMKISMIKLSNTIFCFYFLVSNAKLQFKVDDMKRFTRK